MRALAKVEQVLPARLRRRVDALQSFTVPLPMRGAAAPTVDPATLTVLAQALPRRRAAAVRLHAPGTASDASGTSSRTGWCPRAAAGTSSPGTSTATTGARSGSTG